MDLIEVFLEKTLLLKQNKELSERHMMIYVNYEILFNINIIIIFSLKVKLDSPFLLYKVNAKLFYSYEQYMHFM